MKVKDYSFTFLLFTLLSFIILLGWNIFTDGMFFDGLIYASVSNNLAHGIGSFWHLANKITVGSGYYEQPPFTFFLQSLFYRVFGDGLYVERLYCLFMAIAMMFFIYKVWKQQNANHSFLFWLPIFIWLFFPVVSWTYKHNLEEATMGLFDIIAVFLLLKGCREKKPLLVFMGGGAIFLASFCKGIQGLFPLVVPGVYWLVYRQNSFAKMVYQSLLAACIPAIIYVLFYYLPSPHDFYQHYLDRRIAGTFNGLQNTTTNRFHQLYTLSTEILYPLILFGLFWWIFSKNKKFSCANWKEVKLFLFIGLCGSLPLMVTLEQRSFYLTTSMPYFALALAFLFKNEILSIFQNWSDKEVSHVKFQNVLKILIVVFALPVPFLHNLPKRDGKIIADVRSLEKQIAPNTIIQVSESTANQWKLHGYFMRYARINLESESPHSYYLALKTEDPPKDTCYKKLDQSLTLFDLNSCKK